MICGASKSHITGNIGQVNYYDMCIRNPVRGNQFQAKSKFCKIHEDNADGNTKSIRDLRSVTRQYAKSCNITIDDINKGCKKEDNIDKFYSRTAGIFYIFRPCGIRLSHFEMYTSESLSDVFLFLIDTFGQSPKNLNGIVYDRACGLHPFIKRLSKEGNALAK